MSGRSCFYSTLARAGRTVIALSALLGVIGVAMHAVTEDSLRRGGLVFLIGRSDVPRDALGHGYTLRHLSGRSLWVVCERRRAPGGPALVIGVATTTPTGSMVIIEAHRLGWRGGMR